MYLQEKKEQGTMMLWKIPTVEMALLERVSPKAQELVLGYSPVKGFQGPPEMCPAQLRKRNNHTTYLPTIVKQVRQPSSIYAIAVQSPSHAQLFVTQWAVACQAFPSFTISWILLKLMSIELVMPSNHLILCHPRSQHQGLFQ